MEGPGQSERIGWTKERATGPKGVLKNEETPGSAGRPSQPRSEGTGWTEQSRSKKVEKNWDAIRKGQGTQEKDETKDRYQNGAQDDLEMNSDGVIGGAPGQEHRSRSREQVMKDVVRGGVPQGRPTYIDTRRGESGLELGGASRCMESSYIERYGK